MSTLNQFQQYSQGENTITNNVLLMLSNLYEIRPKYFEEFINGITESHEDFTVEPIFLQQVNNKGNGFIDGFVRIKASKIIIETKIKDLESINKLIKYAKSFDDNEYKLLFHLSIKRYSEKQINTINSKLNEAQNLGEVNFYSLTYQDLVDQLIELVNSYPYDHTLTRLSEDFQNYCIDMKLMPASQHILRAMTCGKSFELNIKHQFYFDFANRGYRPFNYLGIYKLKSVHYIGRVENAIVADWNRETGLMIKASKEEVTEEQKSRLSNAIQESVEWGWKIERDHRFFLLNDFHKTDYRKNSPGGIFRVRYFNLEKLIEGAFPSNLKEVALKLEKLTWN